MLCRFYLPPIILFAGLSVRKKAFFRNLPTIACMGIVGTYIAFAIIAGLLAAIAKVFPGITLAVSAVFAGAFCIFRLQMNLSICSTVLLICFVAVDMGMIYLLTRGHPQQYTNISRITIKILRTFIHFNQI